MSFTDHFEKLTSMYLNAATNRYYSPTIVIGKGSAEISIAVRPDFFHSADAVHGSVYFKLLDDAAYFAASSVITDFHLVTVSFNLYFLRPVSKGIMKGVGALQHRSSRLIVAEAKVLDENNKVAAQGCGTFMKTDIPLDKNVGYC
jgi:uncharacterized protein (TIGR00369 family)